MENKKCIISKIGNVNQPVVEGNIEVGRKVKGLLTSEPTEGGKCIVYHDAKCFITSKITKIVSQTDSEVVFETLNSIYKLEYVK